MSSTITVSCDKCGDTILENRIQYEVRVGPLRQRRPQVDLCAACARMLDAWLAVPPEAPPQQDGVSLV